MTPMRDFRFGPSGKSGTAFTFSCTMRTFGGLNHLPSFGARNRKEAVMRKKRLTLGFVLMIGGTFAANDAVLAVEYRGTPEQQMACTPDVWRLCASQIPDVGRIVACLRANTPRLSEGCRGVCRRAAAGAGSRGPSRATTPARSGAAALLQPHAAALLLPGAAALRR
jgi:hypothetical protein